MNDIDRVYFAMIAFYRGEPKRIQHFAKVHSFARLIGTAEGLNEKTLYTLEIAALVHDIGIKPAEAKYHSSMGKYQEQEGPAEVQKMLSALNIDPAVIERVSYLVGHHHTYTNIDGIDYQILVEADFLVNLYEDGLKKEAAVNVERKIFKTAAGVKILREMFDTDNS